MPGRFWLRLAEIPADEMGWQRGRGEELVIKISGLPSGIKAINQQHFSPVSIFLCCWLPDQLLGDLLEPDKEEERDPPESCAFLATKPQSWRL